MQWVSVWCEGGGRAGRAVYAGRAGPRPLPAITDDDDDDLLVIVIATIICYEFEGVGAEQLPSSSRWAFVR